MTVSPEPATAARPLSEAPLVNPFDQAFQADPVPIIDEARRRSWLVRTPIGGLVIDREHVHRLLSDPRLTSALVFLVRMQGVTEGPVHDMVAASLLGLDGDDHARIRRLVSRSFTPRAVDPHRPQMRVLAGRLVEGFARRGECEFLSEFADDYPIQVMCNLLGVPPEDHGKFARWGNALTHVLSLDLPSHLGEVRDAISGLAAYLDELIAQRASAPADDLVSELTGATDAGDRLSPAELRALLGGLLFAGYDTTRNQLALAMTLFSRHPDQWQLLAGRPQLAPRAVEEVLRVWGTVAATPRLAISDVEMDGWAIPKGTLVTLSLAAANHDPASGPEPHRFDITADREPQLTFGGGPHYCLGANLARAEMQEALPLLAANMPGVTLAGDPEWRGSTGIFGPTSLPLRFTPAATTGR